MTVTTLAPNSKVKNAVESYHSLRLTLETVPLVRAVISAGTDGAGRVPIEPWPPMLKKYRL
jgi:hypothetical protein